MPFARTSIKGWKITIREGGRNMKRSGILLLVGGFMTGIFSITACTAAAGGASANQRLVISQEASVENQALPVDLKEMTGTGYENAKHQEAIEPQLEPFDKACEESIEEFYLRLAREQEPQLEPFDKASEESLREFYLRLARERRIDREVTFAK